MKRADQIILLMILLLFIFVACDSNDDESSDGSEGNGDTADDDDSDDDDSNQNTILTIEQGNLQSAFVESSFNDPLVVLATDENGEPISELEILFTHLLGKTDGKADATLSVSNSTTGTDGQAECLVDAGQTPGMVRIRAEAQDGSARPVTFTLSVFPEPTENKKPICFLSINDFHTHIETWGPADDPQGGLARIAYAFKTIRENNDKLGIATVIFNAGDDFENTLYHDVPGFLAWLIETWDKIGVDSWQVGNHDYHFGIPFLTDQVETAQQHFVEGTKGHKMNVTFGNVDPSTLRDDLSEYIHLFETDFTDIESKKLYEQTTVVEAGDIRVGIVGAVTSQAIFTQVPGDPKMLRFLDAANEYAEKMTFIDPVPGESSYIGDAIDSLVEQGVDLIVVNSHVGLGFGDRVNLPPGYDDVIAMKGQGTKTGRGVDIVISGHSHVQLNVPIVVENAEGRPTPIAQAREGGLFISRVDAMADLFTGGMEMLDGRLIQVNADLGEDEAIAKEVDDWREKSNEVYPQFFQTELAANPVWLSHRAGSISGLGNLINEAFMWTLKQEGMEVDSSIVVPSLYRSDLWPGAVTKEMAYGLVPLHHMNEIGTDPDTVAILTLPAGEMTFSTMLLPGSWKFGITALEYALEFIHTLPDLTDRFPAFGKELDVDILQIGGITYEVDLSAPPFQHIIPGSVRVNGEPIDPKKTYTIAVVETFASTLSAAMGNMIKCFNYSDEIVTFFLENGETGKPFIDTKIPLYQAVGDYLAGLEDDDIPLDVATVQGRSMRPVQPDLAVNPTEMQASNTVRGEEASFSLRVRNLGLESVKQAKVRLLVDTTPWDLTDHDDGNSELEGLGKDYLGSLTEIGSQVISVESFPKWQDLTFYWSVPENLPQGMYTLHARVEEIVGDNIDPNTQQPYTDWVLDNGSGEQVMIYFQID